MTYKEWREEYIDKPIRKRYNELKENVHKQIEEYSKEIRWDRQNRHIRGEKEFKEGRSELTENPEMLIKRYSGKGDLQYTKDGRWKKKEIFVHDDKIGVWVSPDGERKDTNRGTIHYSKKHGVHIVPAYPDEE